MQSKLVDTTMRWRWLISAVANKRFSQRVRASHSMSRTADPAIHSGDPEGIDADEAAKAATVQQQQQQRKGNEGKEPFSPPTPPYASSPKLESTGVNQPLDPVIQQKRHCQAREAILDVSCVGLDGAPLPMGCDNDEVQQQLDDQAYFKDHKPSPLSEVEYVDTRKPITRATDGTAGDYGGGEDVIGWREEQLDTAEEALMRAVRIWRESAMRGDPDSPQSRVLRRLRGE